MSEVEKIEFDLPHRGELPGGVRVISITDKKGREAKTYSVDNAYNDETLRSVERMAAEYPRQNEVFEIVKDELEGRVPILPKDGESPDPSRENRYEKPSPCGLGFEQAFRIIASFPPDVAQYKLLRNFLFHPDLDVRHKAASAIELRRSFYPSEIQVDFDQILDTDPDRIGRLKLWINSSRRHWEGRGANLWELFVASRIIERPQKYDDISDEYLRTYFALDRDDFYEPRAASKQARMQAQRRATERMLGIVRKEMELEKKGELTDEVRRRDSEEIESFEMEARRSFYEFPNIYRISTQLWRLNQKELLAAISAIINRPEIFHTEISSLSDWHLERIVARGVRACAFIEDQDAAKVMITSPFMKKKWRESGEVVSEASLVCYMLKVEDILSLIWPLALKHRRHLDRPVERVGRSLGTAILREVSGERLPKYGYGMIRF